MKNKQYILHGIVLLCIVCLDQITKFVTVANLREFQTIELIPGFFNFTYVKNTGAAWGIFNQSTILLTILSIGIIALFIYMYRSQKNRFTRFFLVVIIAGAIGNLIDRIRLNYVVDFLDFTIFGYHFPVFNVADIAVCLGTFALFLYVMLWEKDYATR